ncbi:MAG TPA: phosphate acyltransferase PlsX [Armatimonadota bacterium]|nr:phosphate acyltransferase PlsX [Armatimonadota bacterium]
MPGAVPIRIALDAMGGDFAPAEAVRGAVESAGAEFEVLLFGDETRLQAELASLPSNPSVSIVHASEEVDMHDAPVEAVRQKMDSSLRRAAEAVLGGEADAIVSAGNTGAAMMTALRVLGRVEGVHRPAIAATLPTQHGKALLIDAGANLDCDVRQLVQFAAMGDIFVRQAWEIQRPRVGLLNIGEEPTKGNALARQTHERLRLISMASDLNFIGNVEGRELFAGKADVVVCDGFAGNVLLKAGEGVAEMVGATIASMGDQIGSETLHALLRKLREKTDYAVYGGAPLLGINGVCFVAHGRSRSQAIANALRNAAHCVCTGVLLQIREQIRHSEQI